MGQSSGKPKDLPANQGTQNDAFPQLPSEIQELIFSFCPIETLVKTLPLVSRKFRNIIEESVFVWTTLYTATIGYPPTPEGRIIPRMKEIIRDALTVSLFGNWQISSDSHYLWIVNRDAPNGAHFRVPRKGPPKFFVETTSRVSEYTKDFSVSHHCPFPRRPALADPSKKTRPFEHDLKWYGYQLRLRGTHDLIFSASGHPLSFRLWNQSNGWVDVITRDETVGSIWTGDEMPCREIRKKLPDYGYLEDDAGPLVDETLAGRAVAASAPVQPPPGGVDQAPQQPNPGVDAAVAPPDLLPADDPEAE
ncbi:hypothetical protein PAPYR_6408 [Paratrimastix pyriformis]|uniref:F-box domain-containing protein n=1 Tax=Paratrimastix pyriformis TaxID=342808 RepID=A0ABQ8UFG3_9EUKA|nr:hypothetical protein PAPYR_6408 [Paratrimastix pyriformis]